ncbi:C39 family peptidase [Akkermansiaceae bacterium]|nr:C39 family peptidase [Akkermansiaceae bacterium]MDB4537314.1 C39 family peptidase [Akkermansiaceae bacterium]
MKLKHLPLVFLPLLAHADESATKPSLNKELLTGKIWERSLADIKAAYEPKKGEDEDNDEIPEEVITRLTTEGVTIVRRSGSNKKFEWLSSQKKGLRAAGKSFTLLGKEIGEINIRSNEETANMVDVSVYNRGDDGNIKKDEYLATLQEWKGLIDDHLGVRPRQRDKSGVVDTTGWIWQKDGSAYLLEGSLTRKSNRAEFIRLRIAPQNTSGRTKKLARRSTLDDHVKENEAGDVIIQGIPMVDQGQKGYCVVASIERVGRYYGLSVDQHEMAQVADTTEDGTSSEVMEQAFKKITGKIHVRTIKLMDYDYRQTEKDYKAYDREAKKQGAKVFNIDLDTHYVIAQGFWQQADKEVFKTVKAKQTKYTFFQSKVKEFIDQGIPICWTLYLGMFPEKEGQQQWGGHMRIIHGYNEKTQEIFYTDSWGAGHELKKMPAIHAWCMTTGLYAMVPNN